MKLLTLIISLVLFQSIYTYKEEDKVQSLPDYAYNGPLYSGYLDVSDIKKFHYMLNIAEGDAEKKPLVVWFNGGPGCSSLDGWANEHGPMLLDDDGNFQLNNYSWVKEANMLYIESPGNVGFSYINSTSENDTKANDNITASDNLNAVIDFFKKFPSFKTYDFYVSGESYAGVYVPTLAYKILEYNNQTEEANKINLKGILVGNGVADWDYDDNLAMIDFAFTHHFISYEQRLEFNHYCYTNASFNLTKCFEIIEDLYYHTLNGVNIYDYLRECKVPKKLRGGKNSNNKYFLYAPWFFKRNKAKYDIDNILKLNEGEEESDDSSNISPCFDDTKFENYFNRKDVQEAIHATPVNGTFVTCSESILYNYLRQDEGSIWTYPTLIKAGLRILIYSGDTDMVVPFNGNQLWIKKKLGLKIKEPWRQWRAYGDKNNVSGYVTYYEGLTFCTIKGVGHMPPGWKPRETYYMFSKFLRDETL